MTVIAIVQARMGSSRLPGKTLMQVGDRPLIDLLLERLGRAKHVDKIVVAITTAPPDDALAAHLGTLRVLCARGSEEDVLERYWQAARQAGAQPRDVIIRVTGDCPLVDPALVDRLVEAYLGQDADYVSNVSPPSFPDGLDLEMFSFAALCRAQDEVESAYDREHVTPYLRESGAFTTHNVSHAEDLSALRWTVDEQHDLNVIRNVVDAFAPRTDFTWTEVLELTRQRPDLFKANAFITRNEGADMGRGQKHWKHAKSLIPGGNMLLSKRAEMFLPDQWPAYFSRSQGCIVWDMDNRRLIDTLLMGVGTNTLGYAHPEVDAAVRAVIDAGNMTTLNAPEEVWLAEELCKMHPFADMARFCRSGGEANAVAIRIARAASGRDQVALCGYHGWHDWYLAANLGDEEGLDEHLLPGLKPRGVPRDLRGSVHPFRYNRIEELETLLAAHPIGVIKMEVSRNEGPGPGYLQRIRALADQYRAVLIFDECTSGFRETFGGLHKKFCVMPDLAVFGKALGNGYAITGVIGRREVMEAAQSSFISSTFWTERIGPAAALATLKVMERERSWEQITAIGAEIRAGWIAAAARHSVPIKTSGLDALCGFSIVSPHAQAYKTLITQEMLKRGYLAGDTFYASLAHTPDIRAAYLSHMDEMFALVARCESDGRDPVTLLAGPVAHSGFKRLN
ncbi:aminotransferase class III-fold pyridoxal phosphate-dependent enzyme [Anianabacter salinae]|uniref:aminotransferase class III-fold pyridoxal phosphate-dependent enzyme n=1 Tax=Anianabacter salinae TaxID=2851023 RepID=UPI00225E33F1|nr:aminotransferase class III-fold pyridoxal phosphate-dependent enzyme [Anianabacter salinae]MBV0914159.1 aminotransferase class III-fold pyridoxal phosphate-dependent enzyme [Anianabacter salinae]